MRKIFNTFLCKMEGHPYEAIKTTNEGYTITYKCPRCGKITSMTTPRRDF